jgi:hypothetical protein
MRTPIKVRRIWPGSRKSGWEIMRVCPSDRTNLHRVETRRLSRPPARRLSPDGSKFAHRFHLVDGRESCTGIYHQCRFLPVERHRSSGRLGTTCFPTLRGNISAARDADRTRRGLASWQDLCRIRYSVLGPELGADHFQAKRRN